MRILVGDVGGTHTRLACWEDGTLREEHTVPSGAHEGLLGPVREWLAHTGIAPERACFGVAGPVRQGRCVATNLPWIVDEKHLGESLGVPVRVVNDFHAAARGVTLLGPGDSEPLLAGDAEHGAPLAVLGAGTGLGEAVVVGNQVVPGEGAHAEFGPANARELRLAAWLIARQGRATWEDVLSGPGLVAIQRFLAGEQGAGTPAWLDDPDAPARVAASCPEALDWFAGLYGAEAGNLALRVLARGGVWLCGGIAPRILPALRAGRFAERFHAKGKVSAALEGIPVRVVTHPGVGLLGAAGEALQMS
jgi:glucokinase